MTVMNIPTLAGIALISAGLLVRAPLGVEFVAEVAQLQFHSDFLLNLHHTLYGAAWDKRPEAGTLRAFAGRLPAPARGADEP